MKIIDIVKQEKLAQLDVNFKQALSQVTISGNIYATLSHNLIDLIGLITLNSSSNIGVYDLSTNTNHLKMHTVAELITVLNAIKNRHVEIKTARYNFKLTIEAFSLDTDVVTINNLDITL